MGAEGLLDIAMIHADNIIAKAQKGDQKALNQLVSLWYKRIYNYILKYFGDHDTAVELAQQTFISMFRYIINLKDVDRFKPWLYRIATNLCYEESRKRKQHPTISLTILDDDQNNDHTHRIEAKNAFYNPEKRFSQLELEKILLESMGELNHSERTVIIMKEYEGLKFTEIAEALDTSENTVKARLYRGLKKLRDILERNEITKDHIS